MDAAHGMISMNDELWMRRAIQLASRGLGYVEPNPMVGAVLVNKGVLAGEGWHQRFGGPHAEINALSSCGMRTEQLTLYVTLEPCCHHGKTPPCTESIIRSGIKRVVIGCQDPNPSVCGKGIAQLKNAGILVEGPVLPEDSKNLILPFIKLVTQRKPWTILKSATSLDGKIATKNLESKWITGSDSRKHAHQWRGKVDAIAVGINTAMNDNPMLTARPSGPRVAARVVFDRSGKLSDQSVLVKTAKEFPLLVVTTDDSPKDWRNSLENAGAEILIYNNDAINSLLLEAGKRNWTRVLIEGGGTLMGAFLDSNNVDEFHLYQASKLIGGCKAPSSIMGEGAKSLGEVWHGRLIESIQLGNDTFRRFVKN